MGTTVAAIATPAGSGGLGTVRISGDDAVNIADRVFISVSGRKLRELNGYTALLGRIVQGEKTVDEAVALVFKAPKSYTGENVVELSVHGGEYVVNRVLRAVLDAGALLAGPGEFTKRAFLNGKMDLSQAEAVMDIISANGEQALNAGNEALGGVVSRRCESIKEKLTFAAATVAAFSDFPDEEPEFSGIDKLEERLIQAEKELRELIDGYDTGRMIRNGISTVIAGPPNAGKSTLMNLLSGYERSIVTPIAGTTRDVLEETVRFGSVTLRLSDTAGLRDTEDEVERIGVERSKSKLDTADLILAVIDGSEALSAETNKLINGLSREETGLIYNKSDKGAPDVSFAEKRGMKYVIMSAADGSGLESLKDMISELTGTAGLEETAAVYLNERQRNCAVRALKYVKDASEAYSAGFTIDAVGVCLDDGLAALAEITGERVTSMVADEVFKNFCVGK